MNYKRLFTRLIAIVIIVSILSSSAFVLLEADHECMEDCCLICNQLAVCLRLIRSCTVLMMLILLFRFSCFFVKKLSWRFASAATRFNPITLKVKLSD